VSQSQPDPNQNQPISCQALLASGANAVIASSDPDGKHTLPPSGSTIYSYLFNNFYNADEHDNDISRLEQLLAGKISVLRLGPLGQSPTAVDRTAVNSNLLVTEQSLLGWMQGQLTENGAPYIIGQPKLYITDSTLTTEITTTDGSGNDVVEFVKARVNSSKDGGFDSTDDRRLATNLAINQYLVANYQPLGGSSGSSSSLTIDTEANATSTATRTAQVVGTGIFYQNGTQLRVQYKSSSSNYQDVLIGAFDTTSPVITILGDNPASIIQGATYTDAGATAQDNVDGDITSAIQTTINVDTSTTGTNYSVTYTVSDGAGNVATAIRAIHVVPPLSPTYQWDFRQGSMPNLAQAVGTVSFSSDGMTTTTTNHARLYSTGTSDFAPSFFAEFSVEFFFKTANFDAWKDLFIIEQPQNTYGTVSNQLQARIGSSIYGFTGERFMLRDYYHKTGQFSDGKFNATDAPLATNTFFHLVYTHKNNPSGNASRKLYLNGTLQTSFGNAYGGNGDIPTTGNDYSIKLGYVDGANPNQSDTWKYFRIYNSELSATEVAQLYADRNN
jgi:hypothetical protein